VLTNTDTSKTRVIFININNVANKKQYQTRFFFTVLFMKYPLILFIIKFS